MSTDDPYAVARAFYEQVRPLIEEQDELDRLRRLHQMIRDELPRLIAEGEARHEEWLRETGIGEWFDTP